MRAAASSITNGGGIWGRKVATLGSLGTFLQQADADLGATGQNLPLTAKHYIAAKLPPMAAVPGF